MEIRKALFGRLERRKSGRIRKGPLSAALSNQEKIEYVANLIGQTVLPRQITLQGDNAKLILWAAEKYLNGMVGILADQKIFEYNSLNTNLKDNPEKELISSLTKFFEHAGKCELIFADIPPAKVAELSFHPKVAGPVPPAEVADPDIPAKKNLHLGSVARPKVEKPTKITVPENVSPKSRGIPFTFLAEVLKVTRKALHFSTNVAAQSENLRKLSNPVEKDRFLNLNKLHATLAPELGQELLFVVVAEGDTKDTFAFALDGVESVAVEMDRQKIGRVCQAWKKVHPVQK